MAKKTNSFYLYASTLGNGAGDIDAVGNYAAAAQDFHVQPEAANDARADEIMKIRRMIVFIEDSGNFRAEHYGALMTALAVGIKVLKLDSAGNIIQDFLGGATSIKSNGEWASTCYDMSNITFGAGNEFIVARWTFSRAGKSIVLHGEESERLVLRCNDDLSGLEKHRFMMQGSYGL